MENILPMHLQELVFSSSDPKQSKQISKLEKAGKLKKIASRIYTSNFTDSPEAIVRRNIFDILGNLYPGAVLSHRSAFEFQPTSDGYLFLTYSYTRKIYLPGVTLRFLEGPGPIEGDNRLSGELYAAQRERALLENLQVSRQQGAERKTLSLPALEDYLEQVIRVNGDAALNALRDRARIISTQLDMPKEFEKLNRLISALLVTQPSRLLSSPAAVARAFGNPYDPMRLLLFEKLFIQLKQQEFKDRPEQNSDEQSFQSFAFFEAYFSNYIEGTEFELEDAKKIIATQTPMPARDEDSHDVLGTYKLVGNKTEMKITPDNANDLLDILLYRHSVLLSARKSKLPGRFKDKNNRAGDTHFVDYMLVRGTLIKGFDFYQALIHPFARAAYMMFLISEVHPFLDGNGRMARVMMNAELVRQNQARIIIPTVYRDDYLGALKRLTKKEDPVPYIRMLTQAHEFSATIVGQGIDDMESRLRQSNAFEDHTQAHLKIIPPTE